MTLLRLACGLPVLTLTLLAAACASDKPPQELSAEAVCRNHFEHDPVELARCSLDPELRKGAPPDARPQELPIRNGGLSD
jgi:hypothetical protein